MVVPILTQHYVMLQHNLLYTAVTRARELVVLVLVGSRRAIAVRNDKIANRNSGLAGGSANPINEVMGLYRTHESLL